jgi:hypothetical protein
VITSAFRPQAYQNHLREIWDKRQLLLTITTPECREIRDEVTTEFALHSLVARPANVSNHSNGNAFDARVRDLPAGQNIDTLAGQCNLTRPEPDADPVHFER